MIVGDIIRGKQQPQKLHLKNKGKFDTWTFTSKQPAFWQGQFLIFSTPKGLLSPFKNSLQSLHSSISTTEKHCIWSMTRLKPHWNLSVWSFQIQFFSFPFTLWLLVLLEITKSSETRKWNLTWEYFHLLPIKNGYIIPKIFGFAYQNMKNWEL